MNAWLNGNCRMIRRVGMTMHTVMIVDDSLVARSLLRDILEECGYTVVAEAADGVEAVEKYAELRPQVTIMDVKMPRKDGIEATREILVLNGDAKVLMCSSTDNDSLRAAAVEAGACGVIAKPFILEKVAAAIEAVL
jgi:two-component system chemotaxis response regulator CheY